MFWKRANLFKFEIENSEDKMKSFCLNLRNEIQLETEVLIKKIQIKAQFYNNSHPTSASPHTIAEIAPGRLFFSKTEATIL